LLDREWGREDKTSVDDINLTVINQENASCTYSCLYFPRFLVFTHLVFANQEKMDFCTLMKV